jgi:putative acetyltransferase
MIRIEKFEKNNAKNISDIIIDNLLRYNAKDYSLEVIKTLVEFYSPEFIIKYSENEDMYITRDEITGEIIGTVSLNKNQVRNLFIKDGFHGKGLGRKLMDFIEFIAEKRKYDKIILNANKTALGFYLRLEYKLVEETDEKVGENFIRMYKMEKDISEDNINKQ